MSNGIRFEQGYLFRNHKNITSIPDIALTEFISNSWDAGAYNVDIRIPYEIGQTISIEDDGTGMTDEEFRARWMTLNYNRRKQQGDNVVFPNTDDKTIRKPYGRNGIGRHGMLCFSDYYFVETWKDGILNKYKIEISEGDAPYKITEHQISEKKGHGTKLSTEISRHVPDFEQIKEILSVRFLYDPQFSVKLNGNQIDLMEHKGIVYQEEITLLNKYNLKIIMIDSTKTAIKNQQHGLAFWVSNRLVGSPSWSYNNIQFIDGRLRLAKKYTIVIKSDDIEEFILPDWSGFYNNDTTNNFFDRLEPYINKLIKMIMKDQIESVQYDIIKGVRDEVEGLSISGKRDISKFLEEITEQNPVINPEFLKLAVETFAKIEKSKNGERLLQQLNSMEEDSLNKLSDILNEWTIEDIATVLDEIDKRIVVIETLERLGEDKTINELHTIHPIILNSRWLFGAEFDSPMFTSNKTLSTVVKELFKDEDYDLTEIENSKKRPDIVCLKKYSLKAVCSDKMDSDAKLMKPDQILIIEVKRGGFEITPEEVAQVEYYVRQIKKSAVLHKDAEITAYVVGNTLGDIDTKKETSSGRIFAVTFGQLIETSRNRLFKLRDSLREHYDNISTENIIDRALKEPHQLEMKSN